MLLTRATVVLAMLIAAGSFLVMLGSSLWLVWIGATLHGSLALLLTVLYGVVLWASDWRGAWQECAPPPPPSSTSHMDHVVAHLRAKGWKVTAYPLKFQPDVTIGNIFTEHIDRS